MSAALRCAGACMNLRSRSISACTGLALAVLSLAAGAGPVLERVESSGQLRVCIWPDYYGVSFRNPRSQQLEGIDIELSQELARDLKLTLSHVNSSFATLVSDLAADRCDVAMFSVGVTPERQKVLAFTQPYLQSDIYAVTTRGNASIQAWGDIDQPGVRVAVQAGTFMEPVMAAALKRASLVVIRPPMTREQELTSGRVDVFMTDYPYSRRLMDSVDWVRLLAPPRPFHLTSYAYAVKPGDPQWLAQLDAFVMRIKVDGRLARAAARAGLGDIVVKR